MTDEKPQRISIGFIGGQALSARVKPEALVTLRKSLGSAGWHELKAEDGTVALDLAKVVFVPLRNLTVPRSARQQLRVGLAVLPVDFGATGGVAELEYVGGPASDLGSHVADGTDDDADDSPDVVDAGFDHRLSDVLPGLELVQWHRWLSMKHGCRPGAAAAAPGEKLRPRPGPARAVRAR